MKKVPIGLFIAFLLANVSLAAFANGADAPAQQVSTRDLRTLQVPGKVADVIWTVRPERCTLQIVFPNADGRAADPKLNRHPPSVQAWLLRADGTVISSIERSEPGAKGNPRLPFGIAEILFAFPRSADTEAVAVALRVDDVFSIERLASTNPSAP